MYKDKSPLNITKKPVVKDWHRADIIAAVRKTGTNLQELSRSHGFKARTLSNALYSACPKYERLIAEHLGIKPQAIWPTRYHKDGTSKSGRGERGLGVYKAKAVQVANDTPESKSRNVYGIDNRKTA